MMLCCLFAVSLLLVEARHLVLLAYWCCSPVPIAQTEQVSVPSGGFATCRMRLGYYLPARPKVSFLCLLQPATQKMTVLQLARIP